MPERRVQATAWLAGLAVLLGGCGGGGSNSDQEAWTIYPLQRRVAHDGLAVVSQPNGYGLHIFLETDTSDPAVCQPRWIPDPARLFNGTGSAPFSSGLAARQEFFDAVQRQDVVEAMKRELQLLCQARAAEAEWRWLDPPRSAEEVIPVQLPAWEEEDLLTDPSEEKKRQDALLNDETP
ncbi:MAG: hypothetical protein CL862_02435 [Cyanobium sp. NAT70]|mgnify:CR=1 FL=1|nr:hypothetical protein [Cyanobium sp. NAT70]MAR08773.1 hypothetical protein [Blastopirellula sp.]